MPPARGPDPSPSFRFQVEIDGINVARFAECGGLELEQQTFDYPEGGVNSRVHRFPGRFSFGNLTLKKGIATDGQTMWEWIQQVVQGANRGSVATRNVTVTLYDPGGQAPQRSWVFQNAYPVKWSASALSAEQSAIAIETLTLAHQGMSFAQ